MDPNEPTLTAKQKAAIKRAKQAEMDKSMKGGAKKHKQRKFATGGKVGKVRGCGVAKRGLGRASSRGR